MARPKTGLCYKRFSIGFSKELDAKVKRLNNLPGFCHCSYAERVRILMDAGFAAMTERYPELKSPMPPMADEDNKKPPNGGG